MLKALDSPYNKWVAAIILGLGLLDLNLTRLTIPPQIHTYVAGLLVLYGCYIMLRIRWITPLPKGASPPPRLVGEGHPRGYATTVSIVILLFLFRAAVLVGAVGYLAHALAPIEPGLYSTNAQNTLPYLTMQFRHTTQIVADILEAVFPNQPTVLINPKHPYALPAKGTLTLVHTILIVGTGIIIFKLGRDKGALEEIKKTLEAGQAALAAPSRSAERVHG